ncbi:MAG: hypothetical protein IT310_11785 [Anaerolineales bacterium]|nr:hypothetical protein [Anaerolineales bacterium]
MMSKLYLKVAGSVLLLSLLFSLFATSALALQSSDPTVQVFRLNRLQVIIKITFPNEISGNFAGTLGSGHFDCVTTSSKTLLCIGPFRVGPDYATLTIYDVDTKENIFKKALKSPPYIGNGEETPEPTPTEGPCVEC